MSLGPRVVPAGIGAVAVRPIPVPGARGPVSVRRARSGGAGHDRGPGGSRGRGDGGSGRRGDGCRGHGRRCDRARGPAMTHAGRALARRGPMAGARLPVCVRRPDHDRASCGRTACAAAGNERPAVARRPASAMRRGALSGRAACVTALGRCVERCRCRSGRRRGRGSQRSDADRERDEPEEHDGGNSGKAETEGGGAQQPGAGPGGCPGGCRSSCRAGRRRIGGR